MKYLISCICVIIIIIPCFGQNVGIGTNTPLVKLSVQTPTGNYGIIHTDGNITLGTYIGNGEGWLGTKSNNPLSFFTNNSNEQMTLLTNGNFGIGTTLPVSKLTIQTPDNTDRFTHKSDGGVILTEHIGGISATIGTSSNHTFRLVANNVAVINIDPLGNVGVGVTDQTYKMDIANRIRIRSTSASSTAGIALNNSNNSVVSAFVGTKDLDLVGLYGSTSGWGLLMNTNTGAIGIGFQNPVAGYRLSVLGNQYIDGLIKTTGGAEIAGGAQITGDVSLGGVLYANGGYSKFFGTALAYDNSDFRDADEYNTTFLVCSIISTTGNAAGQFIAFSDARIKNISGISNSSKDLQTINSLKITDYTMKDNANYGNTKYKKVIAQEVEKVYPQVVSKHTDYIPNVYQLTNKVERTATGYRLIFAQKHNISSTAKKIKIQSKNKGPMQEVGISTIPSDNTVEIISDEMNTDKIFVYGEQVNDFRAVDYEGLTTLNISATQELSKLIEVQNKKIEALTEEIKLLKRQSPITLVQTAPTPQSSASIKTQ